MDTPSRCYDDFKLILGYRHISSKEPLPEPTQTTVSANAEEQDILNGKTMVAFGDSVTEFGNYPAIIAENTGMTVHNMGFKGTRLAYHPYSAYDEFSLTNLSTLLCRKILANKIKPSKKTAIIQRLLKSILNS